jgi:uncharacterized protein (DUF169 family)
MDNAEFNQALETYLRPLTFPVGVKLLAQPELPAGYRRPAEAVGHRLNVCQGVNFARRYGWKMGFLRQDMACPLSLPIFGYVEDPDFVTRGEHIHPDFTSSLEAAARTQAAQPKAPLGSIAAILLGPLAKVDFTPDLVLVYGSPAQVVRLVQAALYQQGGALASSFSGRCACAQEFIQPWQSGRCNVVIPAQGERLFAMTADDEMAFAIPWAEAATVREGLTETHRRGVSRVPTPFFGMRMEPQFPERYAELERRCGLR